jgi:hypothetical protein
MMKQRLLALIPKHLQNGLIFSLMYFDFLLCIFSLNDSTIPSSSSTRLHISRRSIDEDIKPSSEDSGMKTKT